MTRRLILPILLLVAFVAAGCGGDDGGSGGSLDDSLGYLPKNAPLVVTAQTDLESEQYKNVEGILAKFPFTGQLRNQIKQSIQQEGADYDKDVKPLLGGEMVIGFPDAQGIVNDDAKAIVVFPSDGGKLKELIEKEGDMKKGEDIAGGDAYEDASGDVIVIQGDTLIGGSDRATIEAAVERHDGDDKLTEDDFNSAFGDLPADSMMKVYGDAQALIQADPETQKAREVKWVNGLRKFAFAATSQRDGITLDGRLTTEGLTPEDVPLAVGDQAPGVARFGDFATGIRDAGHAIDWILEVAARDEGQDYDAVKAKLGQQLGIDVDRDLLEQLSGDSTVAGQLDGTVAIRSEVKDPATMRATLKKLERSKGGGDTRISSGGGGLLKATDEDGDELYFGMEGDVFVASPESPARAKAIARVDPQPLPGTKGAMVFVADGETIAKTVIQRSGQNQAAGLFTGPLGDVTAWISAAPEGLRMNAKLKIE